MTKGYYTLLPNRAAVTITGPDARPFLQGLITQDITALATSPLLYSALLTPQGKYEFDFFISADGDSVTLDCEAARAADLAARLSTFKLRKAIEIGVQPLNVFALWGDEAIGDLRDPRHGSLGYRGFDVPDGERVDFNLYDQLRLTLGIPDGSRDFARGEDTVAEMGLEKLNGVSFTKGCYMGQELTSRMHHRGLSKRGLYAVTMSGEILPPFTDIVANGNLIGEMRSSNGHLGLAMLRHDSLPLAARAGFAVTNLT